MNAIVLESARKVAGGKVQLCFSQVVKTPGTSQNILGLLNESDSRFNQQKPRYAWLSAEPADVLKNFGVDCSGMKEGDTLEINLVDPKIGGESLNIRISETTEGSKYDVENFEIRAKRAGKDGDFIMTTDDKYIYVNHDVVLGNATHRLITQTKRVPTAGSESPLAAALSGE